MATATTAPKKRGLESTVESLVPAPSRGSDTLLPGGVTIWHRNPTTGAQTLSIPRIVSGTVVATLPIVKVQVVHGDLLDQDVDAIVNSWNRNIIPWWLLLPQGVSGAIKRRGGLQPFREVGRYGSMPLGSAVWTSAGRLPFKGIIHVAGINLLWRASERSIRLSVCNAVAVALEHGIKRLAAPVIGAGSGGFAEADACCLITDEAGSLAGDLEFTVVRYAPRNSGA